MITVAIANGTARIADGQPPGLQDEYMKRARLLEQIDLENPAGGLCFVGVSRDEDDWPFLVIAQRYSPAG